jgi:hypothetical protein
MARAPSVRQRATRKSAKGGIPKRAFSVANAAERNTKGAMILKIWGTKGEIIQPTQLAIQKKRTTKLTSKAAIKNGLNTGTKR